jgi:hypothetical protein
MKDSKDESDSESRVEYYYEKYERRVNDLRVDLNVNDLRVDLNVMLKFE